MNTDIKTKSKSAGSQTAKGKSTLHTANPEDHPLLLDTFEKAQRSQETVHLIEEHRTQMQTQETLHQARLRSIREQLQLQLFKVWNEVWLQRQKVADQAFKEWLKVFMA